MKEISWKYVARHTFIAHYTKVEYITLNLLVLWTINLWVAHGNRLYGSDILR